MALDLEQSYKDLKDKSKAVNSYNDLKKQFADATKSFGDSLEQATQDVNSTLNSIKETQSRVKRQIKNQFQQLLDLSKITGGGASTNYLKSLLIKALKNIKPKIKDLFVDEIVKVVTGCDQTQNSSSGQTLYVRVENCDLGQMLKIDPQSDVGQIIYEKNLVSIQSNPFSMNRELYDLIQTGLPYSQLHQNLYRGASGQPLFDIQYVKEGFENQIINGVVTAVPITGNFFKITLANRVRGASQLKSFLNDYFSTIDLLEFNQIIARVYDSILNCIKIEANFGVQQTADATKFELYIQRIFGLCFDQDSEISVSGISKLGELDEPINDAFFELTPIDLRNIDTNIANVQKKVIQFVECNNVDIPVNSAGLIESLKELNLVEGEEAEKRAANLTDAIKNDPRLTGLGLFGNLDVAIDTDFIKKIINALISALFSPKALLGLFTGLKIVGQNFFDLVRNFVDFMKTFATTVGSIISKVVGLLVEELVSIIKKDLFNILQNIIQDISKENIEKRVIIVLKLLQLLEAASSFVSDWRKCKSVVDDLLKFIQIALTGFGFGGLPLPLLYACALKPGISTTRANINLIQNLQKLGQKTSSLPSGAPNLHVLGQMSQNKGLFDEFVENNRVEIGLPPIPSTGFIVNTSTPIKIPFGTCF